MRSVVKAIEARLNTGMLPPDFERIFREHYEFLHRTAQRITGNSEDAEDVLQTLFLRLLGRELPSDVRENPRRYLFRATVNTALDVLRTRQRRAESQGGEEIQDEPISRLASRGEEELLAQFRSGLAQLNSKAAEILILRHFHGYSNAEIAKLLGTTRGTIAVSLFRTRSLLKKVMSNYLERK
jgi:RNA polymerase sigma-70 factor (ECF subfamily)